MHQSARLQIVSLIVINLDPQRTIVSQQIPRLAHWRKSVVAIDEPAVKQVVVRHPLLSGVSALGTFQQNARLHSRDRWFSPIRGALGSFARGVSVTAAKSP
jgi:hypothetical protein